MIDLKCLCHVAPNVAIPAEFGEFRTTFWPIYNHIW